MEVVGLRNKGEKNDGFVKFKDNLDVLDKILDCKIFPCDKTSLGYKKKREKYEDGTWSPRTPEAGPSTSKDSPNAPTHDNEDFRSSKMKQGVKSISQRKL